MFASCYQHTIGKTKTLGQFVLKKSIVHQD